MKKPAFVLMTFLLLTNMAANGAEGDGGLWASASLSKQLADQITAVMTLQLRFNDDIDRRERSLLRPSLSYRVDPNQVLSLGYDAHFINLADDKVEQRLWQEYQFSKPFSQFSASLRLRLEQRFIDHVNGVPVRIRIKPALKVPFENSPWFFTLANEFFVAFNDIQGGQRDGFHENRAFAGLGRALAAGTVAQIGYQNQFIERAGRDLITHQLFVGMALKLP